jgi:hypothetical protein
LEEITRAFGALKFLLMKYFAKYLPVEGEIKDMMIHPKNHLEPMSVKGLPAPPIAYSKNGWIPVKLFLCSRDIQVDDKLTNIDGVSTETVMTEGDKYLLFDGNNFKVIGEISPDATWVKEGDEFDKSELGMKIFYIYGKCGSGSHLGWLDNPQSLIGTNIFVNNPSDGEITKIEHIIISIKGPCGHFH